MPVNNPFMPTELRDAVIAEDPDVTEIVMIRRFTELGDRIAEVDRSTFLTAAGLKGEIDEDWTFEVFAQYGKSTQDQKNFGNFNTENVAFALEAEADPDNAGGFRCVDADARAAGCVPINFFGAGSAQGAALDYVSVITENDSQSDQFTTGGHITGSVIDLPAGTVSAVAGVEYRKNQSEFNSDPLAAAGLTSGNTNPNTSGNIEVFEIFGEAVIPLLSGKLFADELTLELAGRRADYDNVDVAYSYNVGASWRPVTDLKIRGGYGKTVRAPNINELFNPGTEGFFTVIDPCALGVTGAGGYAEQSSEVQANCATIPGTATLDPAALGQDTVGGLVAGNPGLDVETGNTATLGMVYTPQQIDGLTLAVDWYDIQIDDAVEAFAVQTTAEQCVRQTSFPNNPFCSLITRDSVTGLIDRIDGFAINVANLQTTGVDIKANYRFNACGTDFDWALSGTHTSKNDFQPFDGGATVNRLDEIGYPEWKASSSLVAERGNLSLAWSARYIDRVKLDNEDAGAGSVDSYLYNDLFARYTIGGSDKYAIYGGIDNVFDETPPELGRSDPNNIAGTNTASDVYDVYGRAFYVGARASF